jgi:phosphatidylethanolamine-binding protein (PEBP) family uncharacterized protein
MVRLLEDLATEGHGYHEYIITVFALKTDKLDLLEHQSGM